MAPQERVQDAEPLAGRAAGDISGSPADVEDAVQAFFVRESPPAPYFEGRIGTYRALCAREAGSQSAAALPLLLAGDDGATYVFDRLSPTLAEAVAAALRARRYRPAGGTLALHLPPEYGGGTGTFALWAAPSYLASGSQNEQVWK